MSSLIESITRIPITTLIANQHNHFQCPNKDCSSYGTTKNKAEIYEDTNLWYCFVCKANGDYINYVAYSKSITNNEAIQNIASTMGFTSKATDERSELLTEIVVSCNRYLLDNLEDAKYLTINRGISNSTIFKRTLGYIPESLEPLKKFDPKALAKVGLLERSIHNGKAYCPFVNRFIFPIRDLRGNTVQLKGRINPFVSNDEVKIKSLRKKTVYSPDHWPSYSALDYLYLEELLFKYKKNYVVVTEGEFDALTLFQLGINAVGLQTCRGICKHSSKLNDFSNIIILLDNDKASQNSIEEELFSLQMALPNNNVWYSIIEGTEKIDINDCFVKQGFNKSKFVSLIKSSKIAAQRITEVYAEKLSEDRIFKLGQMAKNTTFSDVIVEVLARKLNKEKSVIRFALNPLGELVV